MVSLTASEVTFITRFSVQMLAAVLGWGQSPDLRGDLRGVLPGDLPGLPGDGDLLQLA